MDAPELRHRPLSPRLPGSSKSYSFGPVQCDCPGLCTSGHPIMFAARTFTAEQISESRRRYDAGEFLASIARFLDISDVTFRRYRRKWAWGERGASGDAAMPGVLPGLPDTDDGERAAAEDYGGREMGDERAPTRSTRTLSRRVEAAVRRELAGIEKRLGTDADAASAERNARVLASLVKSLAELGRIDAARNETGGAGNESKGGDAETQDERPPRDLAELREELAARLDRLRAERAAGESN